MASKASFSQKQISKIVLLWGQYKSVNKVCWEFAKTYGLEKHPRLLPRPLAFKRVLNRFQEAGSVHNKSKKGKVKTVRTERNIERVEFRMRNLARIEARSRFVD